MSKAFNALASLRLTPVGIAGVIVLAFTGNRYPDLGMDWVAIPLALLAVNLLAAIAVNGQFRRQPALLAFHVCLLAVVTLLAAGVMLRFDGKVELVEGERFDPGNVVEADAGWWHGGDLFAIDFAQGPVEVEYRSGLVRQSTRSTIFDPVTESERTIGDRVSADFDGYRFVTTMNKGYALIVSWGTGDDVRYGSINFPSYPEFEWKQVQEWTPPGGMPLTFELEFEAPAPRDRDWVLSIARKPVAVTVSSPDGTTRLVEGDSLRFDGGTLGIETTRMWMGYRVDYYPLLPWAFAAAMLALLAMAAYFQRRFLPAASRGRESTMVLPATERT